MANTEAAIASTDNSGVERQQKLLIRTFTTVTGILFIIAGIFLLFWSGGNAIDLVENAKVKTIGNTVITAVGNSEYQYYKLVNIVAVLFLFLGILPVVLTALRDLYFSIMGVSKRSFFADLTDGFYLVIVGAFLVGTIMFWTNPLSNAVENNAVEKFCSVEVVEHNGNMVTCPNPTTGLMEKYQINTSYAIGKTVIEFKPVEN